MTYEEHLAKAVAVQKQVFKLTAPNKKAINSFLPDNPPTRKTLDSGITYCNDIKYGKTYPNSFLDIWYAPDIQVKKPTVIYAHGGGYLFGDKVAGDPLAVKASGDLSYYRDLTMRGFNVVSINYCFAPDYQAPAQIIQYGELLDFLNANAKKLDLDMQNIVLMGGSAGANLTALIGLIICDKEYAAKYKMQCSVNPEQVRALVIDEMCLDMSACMQSENMITLSAAWIGNADLINDEIAKQLDVVKHIKNKYIPSYIVSSNVEPWFKASNCELKEKLIEIGCDCEIWYKTQEESEALAHGFMNGFAVNKYAKDCYEKMIEFINKYTR